MMRTPYYASRDLEGYVRSTGYTRPSRIQDSARGKKLKPSSRVFSAIILEFRDEVYASLAQLLRHLGLTTFRAENASELAGKLVCHNPDLVFLSGTQPDESAWLTSAKLRIIDSRRPVWIYSPEPVGALDQWLSMAGIDDVIVYDGVLSTLLQQLEQRITTVDSYLDHDSEERRRTSAA